MCKKLAWVAVAVVVGVVAVNFVGHSRMGSAFKAKIGHWAEKAEQEFIQPEDLIRGIKEDITKLDNDMKGHINKLVVATLDTEKLRTDLKTLTASLDSQERDLKRLATDLSDGSVRKVSFNNVEMDAAVANQRLKLEFDSYQRRKDTLTTRTKELAARERALTEMEKQVVALRDQKNQLSAELANLSAELEAQKAEQMRSKFQLDDSRLSKIKQDMDKVRERIAYTQKTIELSAKYGVNQPTTATVIEKAIDPQAVLKALTEKKGDEKAAE